MDALSLLALQIEWGADEALAPEPVSRLHGPPADAPARRGPATAPPALRRDAKEATRGVTGDTGHAAGDAVLPTRGDAGTPPAAASPPNVSRPDHVGAGPLAPDSMSRPAPPSRVGPVADARAAAAAAADLPALGAVIAAFTGCALRDTATRSVPPTGDPAAGIVIVGEVPDEDEDRAGHPFSGRAGVLLDRMLDSIGLHRDRVLLLPLIPWRPPGGRAPNPIEMNICAPFLCRALVLARPHFVLTMGSRPARVVADTAIRAGAGWKRSAIEDLPPDVRVLAMRHPSYLLSHLPARREAWADLLRLRRALDEADAGRSITAA